MNTNNVQEEKVMSLGINFQNQYGVKAKIEYKNACTEDVEARVVMTYPAGCVQTTKWYKVKHLMPNGNPVEYIMLCEMMNESFKY